MQTGAVRFSLKVDLSTNAGTYCTHGPPGKISNREVSDEGRRTLEVRASSPPGGRGARRRRSRVGPFVIATPECSQASRSSFIQD
ncbi:hypothetical protein D187_001394 [Cystobacter fuscus DSM 2262]|uniref:Uncharacterized protein n=1 Tax=Cystobacter fuscus (strain ATCC 25194 / DSM 2262 / NBRC 100088 / M29) TaxID=1242864 RepID=S9P8H8_CYSF2|nr:hypothetical protein D187_001394 [Cystobacter fuscus DSM 2262]